MPVIVEKAMFICELGSPISYVTRKFSFLTLPKEHVCTHSSITSKAVNATLKMLLRSCLYYYLYFIIII